MTFQVTFAFLKMFCFVTVFVVIFVFVAVFDFVFVFALLCPPQVDMDIWEGRNRMPRLDPDPDKLRKFLPFPQRRARPEPILIKIGSKRLYNIFSTSFSTLRSDFGILWNSVGFKTVLATRSLRPLGDKVLNFFFGFLRNKKVTSLSA